MPRRRRGDVKTQSTDLRLRGGPQRRVAYQRRAAHLKWTTTAQHGARLPSHISGEKKPSAQTRMHRFGSPKKLARLGSQKFSDKLSGRLSGLAASLVGEKQLETAVQ